MKARFADRYGPWALVAGASEGLGAAFARRLAERGLNLVLAARRPEPLAALANTLPTETVTVAADLSTVDGVRTVTDAAVGREVGLVVANAAYSPIGRFLDLDPAETRRALDLNCHMPLALAHHFLPPMAARGHGGFVVMSSLAGQQGSPPISAYAATKAFGAILAEGLWAELRGTGVDVVTCVAGAVATPNLADAKARPAPGTQTPDQVVRATLRGLGRGPRVVPGLGMRVSSVVMTRLLPRRAAIAVIARASRDLTRNDQPSGLS
ncbi:SDR family NAD(P)-dependent oxidoreductase [Asanoa sp. WMMD1127]|uniref:SDR family NAD(P)-dependent oxidoreductase n=1 Tax=Asanoa sp. WMMD1127 TaxID=3016107 RepID=UPI002417D079|nr:SDR family NAD(P)-dependent oxidoreductase [Asanoa sp. WMMD1127]MDG4825635.1 SDR family NAD(P)-dependent oxidoreductase [Asanoa sp. WMMD1127]